MTKGWWISSRTRNPNMATEMRKAFCPICGRTAGREVTKRVKGKHYIALEHGNYWDRTKDYEADKPFGVIQTTEGRGTITTTGYFNPEDDKDGFFPLVKARMMQAMKEWIDKGWITIDELKQVLDM